MGYCIETRILPATGRPREVVMAAVNRNSAALKYASKQLSAEF